MMPNWIRITLALFAGAAAGGASIALIEILGHSMVEGKLIFMVAAAGLGVAGFVGGSIAAWIGRLSYLTWIVASVFAGLALVNVFSFQHPGWYIPVAFILLGLGAGLASGLHKRRSVSYDRSNTV